jgi:nucleoside permease NupC
MSLREKSAKRMDFKMTNLTGFIGIFAMMAISLGMSENRQAIKWKPIAIAVGMQFILAILIAGIPKLGIKGPLNPLFKLANDAIGSILSHVDKGTDFLFGTLGHPEVIGSYIFAVKVLFSKKSISTPFGKYGFSKFGFTS